MQLKQTQQQSEEENKFIYFNKKRVITRTEKGKEIPYLLRHTLFAISKWFSIKLHDIIESDEVCSHDHPWPFLTIILKGGYYEWTPVFKNQETGEVVDKEPTISVRFGADGIIEGKRWHGPGSILYRPSKSRHQLELSKDENGNLLPAKTLVFTGKVLRKWGFFTKKGWIYWRDYDKQRDCD